MYKALAETVGPQLLNPVTRQPIPLAMDKLDLSGKVTPMGGVVQLTHCFKCAGTAPMEAVYVFQLPRGGAVRRFKMKGDGFEVDSKLSPREDARKEYEEGIANGHVSALTETSLDGVISLNVGQVQPDETIVIAVEIVMGVEVRDDGFRFRFPFTMAPNYHAGAKMSGGKVELPQSVFGDLILPEFKDDASELHKVGFRIKVETGGAVGTVSSPSHNVGIQPNADGTVDVWLASVSDQPNRDLVLDVSPREVVSQVFADESIVAGAPKANSFPSGSPRWVATVPSKLVPQMATAARRIVFLIDRSGSMAGARIDQAKKAVRACLSALSPNDEFGIVTFESGTISFHDKTALATDANRKRADKFLKEIETAGGTELGQGLAAAIEVLDTPGHDIVLFTDGEVGETGPIIEQMAAAGTRVHILGIGNAASDRFLAAMARRSGGIQRTNNSQEDVATSALELFNAVRIPRQKDLKVAIEVAGGAHQDHVVETVWEGRSLVLTDNGSTGDTLPTKIVFGGVTVDVSSTYRPQPDGVLALAWAGQQVEDLEASLDMSKDGPGKKSVEMDLKRISTDYSLASRVMSLVAVHKRVGDQAGVDPEQKVVAVGMPSDRQIQGGHGILRAASTFFATQGAIATAGAAYSSVNMVSHDMSLNANYSSNGGGWSLGGAGGASTRRSATIRRVVARSAAPIAPASAKMKGAHGPTGSTGSNGPTGTQRFMPEAHKLITMDSMDLEYEKGFSHISEKEDDDTQGLAEKLQALQDSIAGSDILSTLGTLKADGGLPGANLEIRVVKTALFALSLLQQSSTSIYKAHLKRMADFLEANVSVSDAIPGLLPILRAGNQKLQGDWMGSYQKLGKKTATPDVVWNDVRQAVTLAITI